MTAAELVRTALEAGLRLEPRPGGVLHVTPRERLTPTLREALRAHKAAVLAVLEERQARTVLGVDWTRVSLYALDRILEVAIPWSDVSLVIAPGCRIASQLRARDPKPGRVWCTCEVLDLLLTGVPPEDALKVVQAKMVLNGAIAGVRQEGQP